MLRAHQLTSSGPGANTALTDIAATTEVTGQVQDSLTKVLSYRYDAPQVSEQAAAAALTGKAKQQYRQLFAELRKKAPGQKLTLHAKIVVSAVQTLASAKATLLVFVDQASLRAGDTQQSASSAQLVVTAEKTGDRWKISELRPL